jgi:N-methylhydantoinase B
VRYDLVSRELAQRDYAVVLTDDLKADEAATQKARTEARRVRGEPSAFDFGFTPPERLSAE